MSLFDFRRRDDAADARASLDPARRRGLFPAWRASDDGVIGGYSTSRMEFVGGTNDCDVDDDVNDAVKLNENDNVSTATPSPPFLRWSGNLSTRINRQSHLARNVTRSGFAAIFSPEFPFGAPLQSKYGALEICCRTDGRTYAVNLKVETYFPEDMYQGFIVGGGAGQRSDSRRSERQHLHDEEAERRDKMDDDESVETTNGASDAEPDEKGRPPSVVEEQTLDVREYIRNNQRMAFRADRTTHPYHGHPPLGFQRWILPFRDFALTSRGRMRQQQRDLDGSIRVESIGFTLMDGRDGDFTFDLVSLRAVNVLGGEVVGSVEDDERMERLQDSLRSSSTGAKGKGKIEGDDSVKTEDRRAIQ